MSAKFVELALAKADEDRTIIHPKMDISKFNAYAVAVRKAKEFFTPEIGTVYYDPPENKYSYHALTIKLKRDEFEGNEVNIVADIINPFDSLMFVGSESGDITIQLIMNDIYTQREP